MWLLPVWCLPLVFAAVDPGLHQHDAALVDGSAGPGAEETPVKVATGPQVPTASRRRRRSQPCASPGTQCFSWDPASAPAAPEVQQASDARRGSLLMLAASRHVSLLGVAARARLRETSGVQLGLVLLMVGVVVFTAAVSRVACHGDHGQDREEGRAPPQRGKPHAMDPQQRQLRATLLTGANYSSSSLQRKPSVLPGSQASIWAGQGGTAASLRAPPSVAQVPDSHFSFGGGLTPRPCEYLQQRQPLCPSLVVPDGSELCFAVRDILTKERQQVSFSVVDMESQPLSHVIVNEVVPPLGILVQMLDQTPLAHMRTAGVHTRASGRPIEICTPEEEFYCNVVRDTTTPSSSFALRDRAGMRLCTIHGDVDKKALSVLDPSGRLLCETCPCDQGFNGGSHYQLCVAPGVDACLMLCGVLAVAKLEGRRGQQ